jgi:von Willebrand factor type A domain
MSAFCGAFTMSNSFTMSNFRWIRGMNRYQMITAIGAVSLVALLSPNTRAESAAQLLTYEADGGPTFYAYSMTPPADQAVVRSSDVVIVFDTSASQTGAYRDTALAALDAALAKLRPGDRVALLAADLEARPLTSKLVAANSSELKAAVTKLRGELPLGSTDMEAVLRTAVAQFDEKAATNHTLLYIGDGLSTANLLGTSAFGHLIDQLRTARISVSSYAIGPRKDAALLAAIANQTGGNLYVDEAMVLADDEAGVDSERASDENLRRGAKIGAMLADWTRATVFWPVSATLPAELGTVLPKQIPPLRTDRDTLVFGQTDKKLAAPVTLKVAAEVAGKPIELAWSAAPAESSDNYAYLSQVVDSARADDGLTTPAIGLAGLAETGRVLDNGLEEMNELAKRAVATGDLAGASSMSQAVLQRDPGNIQAKAVQRVVERRAAPAATDATPANTGDLSLIRTAQLPTPPQGAPAEGTMAAPVTPLPAAAAPAQAFPQEGALVDQFDQNGALLDEVEQQRQVFSQLLRREVENAIIDARRTMANDPAAAGQQLKLTLQNVERAPELTPDMRAQLIDKLQIALREVQRQASIKDELDAAREEQLAAAREREMVNQKLSRDIERRKQLVGRFNALVDERRYNESVDVADIMYEADPQSVVASVAESWSQLKRNQYLAEVNRQQRWRRFIDTLYLVETSAIPFPDDPPIVYPDRTFWEELSVRRKKWASVDSKAAGGAEQRINDALNSPLKASGLDFTEEPLENVVNFLQTEYQIPIQLDTPALEDAGLTADEPVTIQLQNVSLRSALRLMLKAKQLTYVIRDEVLIITTPEEAESELVAKVYPVADLVLPIEVPEIGGGMGGGIGGQQGGGGGGGGGFGGGGGGFGGGGGGGGAAGGGGGGFFSVPDPQDSAPADLTLSKATAKTPAAKLAKVASIKIDKSLAPEAFWDKQFSQPCDQATVRQTARELMKAKELDQLIAMIEAALRHGQPQSWMYESLGIAMELDGRSQDQIERVVMSAADFATTPDELMYIAGYLSRSGLDRRALQLCQQVVKIQPLRHEAFALGLQSAEKCDDVAGIEWATVGVLSQAWPKNEAAIEREATQLAHATLARLRKDGNDAELAEYRAKLDAAIQRDCLVRVSWTGDADVDFAVEEPSGSVCSMSEPRTSAGGVSLGDAYASDADDSSPVLSEAYVCPQAFAGKYRVRIHRVWGNVTAGKVTVDVYRHLGSENVEHERKQLDLGDKDALVVFDLDHGRRTEPLEAAQLAGAVERQQQVSQAVLAQQIESGNDPSILTAQSEILRRRNALGALGLGGAVGYQPIIQVLPEGAQMGAIGVISADRRYVRISTAPTFSTIGDVQTFTFAGAAQETDNGTGTGTGTGTGGF